MGRVVREGQHGQAVSGLTHDNEMVFAAKGVGDGVAANGGFHWVAVGSQASATLDATGTNQFGGCAASDTAEAAVLAEQERERRRRGPAGRRRAR